MMKKNHTKTSQCDMCIYPQSIVLFLVHPGALDAKTGKILTSCVKEQNSTDILLNSEANLTKGLSILRISESVSLQGESPRKMPAHMTCTKSFAC